MTPAIATCLLDGYCKTGSSKVGKPRSIPQLRRYFALMREVFHHWPEDHAVQFDDFNECRKWLQMKAGYYEVAAKILIDGIDIDQALTLAEASIKAAGAYAVPVFQKGDLWIYRPKSVRFDCLSHEDFCDLTSKVDKVIVAEMGNDADELLRQFEGATSSITARK